MALAESQDLMDHLMDLGSRPQTDDPIDNTTREQSEIYLPWRKCDRLLRGWIIGTLSEESLSLVVGLDTTHHEWQAFQEAYAQNSQEREF